MNKKIALSLVAASLLSAGVSSAAVAHQAGDFIFRVGAVAVVPNESSPVVANVAEFTVDDNTQVGLNFGYMLTDNWGLELLAATPFSHDVSLGELGKIAETKHLPPTLVAQYYFGNGQSKLRPYIGVGVNFTNFFDNEFTNDLDGALTDLSMSNSWGLAAQVGLDYQFNDNWLVNASVWYADISTDVKFNLGEDAISVETDIDPWVYMVSIGYTF
ncbi:MULTISPECIES: outer membrane protein OmpW [unclassified Shewanella]|uniref:outer membrane protein OmpW n=1 Tax=unclassified Shewanella TaxID=196818 RepID=UPI000C82A194|nr:MULTISPECIES: outer membrane protein OmpW [unclassified Shewanella]MDO6620591.1 outer membrane protein OmpW [Shewanella sp. 6_MG-2023]MDO6641524.1 outer membrane protein OmpW [Shewanella sp. 5_MG-2023]MDO6680006.1 outer membrane protein OmpW [Shewanella sp. 4_MG-2023]PMG31250.1 outer membrane protein OmpW [Shewanella sp. 10N.286.52.C2]PMG39279.1 outer membrane protein OmpW [Shewanella sp. 10N.286.52.B9]